MGAFQPDTSYQFSTMPIVLRIIQDRRKFQLFSEEILVGYLPNAESYAHCLTPNHFHLVVRIRKCETIEAVISKLL